MRRLLLQLTKPAVLGLFAAWLPAQDETPTPKEPDPEIEKKLTTFDQAIDDRKFERDGEAVAIIDELLPKFEGMHQKDQKAFVKALDSVFKARKRKPDQPALYRASVAALGTVGKDASKILVGVFDKKPFDDEEWRDLQVLILENIGRTKDESQVKFLIDRATRDPDDAIKAAAGKALGYFGESKFKVREEIFKQLVRDYMKIEGDTKTQQPNDDLAATRRRTLQAIADPWNATLGKLTGQELRTAEEWQHWYNKNKGKEKAWEKGGS
jgi:hypothetical protein